MVYLACSITFVNILLNFIKVQMYDKSLYLEQKANRTFVGQRDKSQTGFLTFAFKEVFAVFREGCVQYDIRERKDLGELFQTTVISFA